jgi:hypothetical protein
MNIKKYKDYLSFIISIALFVLVILYSLFLYIRWDKAPTNGEGTELEINLPIINIEEYTNLSKKYENDIPISGE